MATTGEGGIVAKIKSALEDFKPDIRLVDERGPTRERLKKSDGYHETGDTGTLAMRDCPLERAYRKKYITKDQHNAGVKFRHHWFHSGLSSPVGSIDLNRVFGGDVFSGPMPKTEAQLFHRQQYTLACKHVGMRTEKILADLICWELPMLEIGKVALGISNRPQAEASVKALMANGLDMLVDLWGLRTK